MTFNEISTCFFALVSCCEINLFNSIFAPIYCFGPDEDGSVSSQPIPIGDWGEEQYKTLFYLNYPWWVALFSVILGKMLCYAVFGVNDVAYYTAHLHFFWNHQSWVVQLAVMTMDPDPGLIADALRRLEMYRLLHMHNNAVFVILDQYNPARFASCYSHFQPRFRSLEALYALSDLIRIPELDEPYACLTGTCDHFWCYNSGQSYRVRKMFRRFPDGSIDPEYFIDGELGLEFRQSNEILMTGPWYWMA
jgi:hypothetical protein